jgi:hypothetical protein
MAGPSIGMSVDSSLVSRIFRLTVSGTHQRAVHRSLCYDSAVICQGDNVTLTLTKNVEKMKKNIT